MDLDFWRDQTVLISGANGFVGRHLCQALLPSGCRLLTPSRLAFDLRDPQQVSHMMRLSSPDIVIHLAAKVGGIGANQAAPAEMFYDNMTMGCNIIHQSHLIKVKKLVYISTCCVYPERATLPFDEKAIWNGFPEETNSAYATAKRSLQVMLQAYRDQYGLNGICLVPANLYGIGENFDLETSHTIPAIIRKLVEAKESNAPSIQAWGTGRVSRDFLYVDDLVEAIILATEKVNFSDPLNVGSSEETIIFSLVHLLKGMIGYTGEVIWDNSRPNGQEHRKLKIDRIKYYTGWYPKTKLEVGLRKEIDWFMANRDKIS